MPERPYLRFPDIHGDTLAFVTDDDVWLGSVDRSEAWRLGVGPALIRNPRLSPDGASVAWASNAAGPTEVWVAPLAGGEARRVTWWGDAGTQLLGWLADGRLLAATPRGAWHAWDRWAWAVPVDGGPAERLPWGPVSALSQDRAGHMVLGVDQSPGRGFAWKRYRGGTAGKIWIEDGDEFRRLLPESTAQLEDPQWWGERIVFLSDHQGWANVYSVRPDGADLRRHSDHGDAYARSARTDGERLVYSCAGDIWILDGLDTDSQSRPLEVRLTSARRGRVPWALDAAGAVRRVVPDRTGRASAAVVRGAAVWLTHRDGPARVLAPGGAVRARLAAPLGDDRVVWVSDAGGEEGLEVAGVDGTGRRRLAEGELSVVDDLAASPDGAWVATAGADGSVRLTDVASGETRQLDRSAHDAAQHLSWSPDSRWLAWSHAGANDPDSVGHLRQIRIGEVATGTVVEATPVRFTDTEPVWTPDGRYLAFLSRRVFDPVYDQVRFDLGFPAATRPYLLRLAAATPDPLAPDPAGRPADGRAAERPDAAHSTDGDGDRRPAPVTVETDGLAGRLVDLPVAAGRLSRLSATARGLVWLEQPAAGELGEGRANPDEAPKAKLQHLDLESGRVDTLMDAADDVTVTGDGLRLVVRSNGSVKVVPADRKAADDGQDSVDVDLSRIRLLVDPAAEWPQMFEEAARLQRHLYWIEDMGGLDWDAVVARYRPLADRVSTRDELTDLIWELHGELGTSHAYSLPPDAPTPPSRRQGYLGVDLVAHGGAWRISGIPESEPSVRKARSPLGAAGARLGDILVAVDGRPVDPAAGPAPLLVGAADRIVEVTLRDGDSERTVAVKALPDELELRYHAWVTANRRAVAERSGGRVGYVHVPNMMSLGWAELQRDLRLESGRDALVVDFRHNGGGHTSELVLERLSAKVTAWDKPRGFEPSRYPLDAPVGPMVAVIDQAAGSDGDIGSAGFRQRGLGPLVGTRTWGGVVGIDDRYDLADGGRVTQPRYAFWFTGGAGWSVEGHGVDPDIEVPIAPHDWAAGRDPQLDAAVATVMAELERRPPPPRPDLADRPSRALPQLPPRG